MRVTEFVDAKDFATPDLESLVKQPDRLWLHGNKILLLRLKQGPTKPVDEP